MYSQVYSILARYNGQKIENANELNKIFMFIKKEHIHQNEFF